MIRKFPNLCRPIQIGNVYFKNRMFGAPMGGTDITKDCTIGSKATAFYENRAKGGVATVTVSELVVHPKTDASHMYHLELETVDSLTSFTYTADAIRRHGAIASVELSHSGQFAGTYSVDKEKKNSLIQWGPSETVRADGKKVHELTIELIKEIIDCYGEKAALAKKAGFEMVMVHGGHGWLINQFLSPFFNKRTDQYGGSLENRVRFAIEVLDSVRKAVGPGFPIEFRLSGSELFEGGYDLEEGIEIAKLIESRIDLLHVTAGSYQKGFGRTHPSMFLPHGPNVFLAAEIKKHVSIPVATVGGLNDPEKMEELIASSQVDIVEMARALLADSELPNKVMRNEEDKIIYCLRCFVCMAERVETGTRRCTVNPTIGRELDNMELLPARQKKKVLVVGAGPGGLQSAYTAARRGHEVILCEKSNEVGGILIGEQVIPFKYEMYRLALTLKKLALAEGVEIRLNCNVDKTYVEKENVDVVIVAAGSKPLVPPIKGIQDNNIILVNEYHHNLNNIKDTVVVLGGGLAGCELAIHLVNEGKTVRLVEMRSELSPDANIRHRPLLLDEIKKSNVEIYMKHKGLEISKQGVLCETHEGNLVFVEGETVICALGQKANREIVDELIDSAPIVKSIGDCVKVSTITTAIYQGHHAALDI